MSGLRIMFRQMGGIAAVSVLTAAVTAAEDPGVAAGIAYGVLAVALAVVGLAAARIPNRRGRW